MKYKLKLKLKFMSGNRTTEIILITTYHGGVVVWWCGGAVLWLWCGGGVVVVWWWCVGSNIINELTNSHVTVVTWIF